MMRCLFSLVMLLSFLVSTGWSQTPFEPFEDNFVNTFDDDDPVTWASGGFPATLTHDPANGGSLILTEPFSLEEFGFSLGLADVLKDGGFVIADNTSAQAVLRVSEASAYAGIFSKAQGDANAMPPGDGGAFFANIRGNGIITLGNFAKQDELILFPSGLNAVENDVVLQLDTGVSSIIVSAWLADQPKPDFPVSMMYDNVDARPPGIMGISFGNSAGVTPVSATFSSFKIVPEPSTVSLVALGMCGLLGFRRRRPLG